MLWIKEVEMVESVDDLKSSCSFGRIRTPDFEALDAKIASALNRIIHNTRSKKKVSLKEQKAQKKKDRLLRRRQIAYLIFEYFWVTGANDSVENYADLDTIVLRNDDIQEFDSKWDGILLSMTKIPSDDILEGLYKLRIWESEKLKTVLEWYNMEDNGAEWLQEFIENLVDDGVPEHRDSHASSSHEPTLARIVDLGKHSVETHFPKDRNCSRSQSSQ